MNLMMRLEKDPTTLALRDTIGVETGRDLRNLAPWNSDTCATTSRIRRL